MIDVVVKLLILFIEFVALAEKISNLLNLNLKDFPLSHCWKYSDHEVALKYIDFEDSEIEVGKLALYNNSEKVIIHEILKDSVVSYVLFDSPDKIFTYHIILFVLLILLLSNKKKGYKMINQFLEKHFFIFGIIKDKREILTNEERKILFSIINDNHENLTDEELYTFVQYIAQMPEKGLSVFKLKKVTKIS